MLCGPTQIHTLNGISTGSAVFAQLMVECPYTLQWDAPFPSKLPVRMEDIHPPANTCFLRPTPLRIPNGISIGSAVFAQLTAASPYTLQWAAPFPLKIAHVHGGRRPGLIHGCLGPPESTSSTMRPAVQLFSARLTIVTDRQTDRPRYSVCNNKPHLRNTATRYSVCTRDCGCG